MEFSKLLDKRHSVRKFQDKQVEDKKIKKIVDSAIKAPSAGDLQAYSIVLVKEEYVKKRLSQAAWGQNAVKNAPACLVFCTDAEKSGWRYGKRGETLYSVQDATIACAYAQLAATDEGLASVWIGAFDEEKAREVLKLPESLRPVALLPVGYAGEKPEKTPRKDREEILREI
jgi:nitroreductase